MLNIIVHLMKALAQALDQFHGADSKDPTEQAVILALRDWMEAHAPSQRYWGESL